MIDASERDARRDAIVATARRAFLNLGALPLLLVAVVVFFASVPRRVLMEHLGMRSGGGDRDGKVIEGDYRLDDDEKPAR